MDGEVEAPPGEQTPDEMQDAAWKAKLEAARGIKPGCDKFVLTGWSGPDKPTLVQLGQAKVMGLQSIHVQCVFLDPWCLIPMVIIDDQHAGGQHAPLAARVGRQDLQERRE